MRETILQAPCRTNLAPTAGMTARKMRSDQIQAFRRRPLHDAETRLVPQEDIRSKLAGFIRNWASAPDRSESDQGGQRDDDASSLPALRSRLEHLEQEMRECRNAVETARRQNINLRLLLADLSADNDRLRLAADMCEVSDLRREVAGLMDRLGAASSSGADIDYSAFEDRFRGDSESLASLQRAYLPYLPAPGPAGVVLDVGCGRGEMLQILIDAGYDAVGVDMDPSMVRTCQAKGLPVVNNSALPYLRAAAPDSFKAIFCAQVVEHLMTCEIEELLRLSLGRLQPGGVLLMETINPTSLHALANHFFADTSHIRPVHPETLKFICQQVGFSVVQVEYRSRHSLMSQLDRMDSGPTGAAVTALLRSVYGFQDYMVLATK